MVDRRKAPVDGRSDLRPVDRRRAPVDYSETIHSEAIHSVAIYNVVIYSEAIYSEAIYSEAIYNKASCRHFVPKRATTFVSAANHYS